MSLTGFRYFEVARPINKVEKETGYCKLSDAKEPAPDIFLWFTWERVSCLYPHIFPAKHILKNS